MLVIFGIQLHLFCHGELMALAMALPVLGVAVAKFKAWFPMVARAAARVRSWFPARQEDCACGGHSDGEKHA